MKNIFIVKRILFACCYSFILFSACKQNSDPQALNRFCQNQLPQWNSKLTEVIISDIFTPAVCSRIYAYTNIAAYEALKPAYKNYTSYAGKLKGLQPVPQPVPGKDYCFPVASVIAFTTVAQKLVFNGDAIKQMEEDFLKQLSKLNVDEELEDSSIAYGRKVGIHILSMADNDGYLQRNSFPAYIVTKAEGRYQPTPPN